MKGYQRRALGKPDFWKLAVWNPVVQCWQDGKRQFDTEDQARSDAKKPGKYRLSFVKDGAGRQDVKEFEV